MKKIVLIVVTILIGITANAQFNADNTVLMFGEFKFEAVNSPNELDGHLDKYVCTFDTIKEATMFESFIKKNKKKLEEKYNIEIYWIKTSVFSVVEITVTTGEWREGAYNSWVEEQRLERERESSMIERLSSLEKQL